MTDQYITPDENVHYPDLYCEDCGALKEHQCECEYRINQRALIIEDEDDS